MPGWRGGVPGSPSWWFLHKVSMWLNAAKICCMFHIIFDESCHVCYTYVVLLYIINFYCVYMHCRWQVAAGTCLGVQEFIFEWKVSMWLNAAIFYDMSYIIFDESCHVCYTYVVLLYIINFYCVYMHCRCQVGVEECLGVQVDDFCIR